MDPFLLQEDRFQAANDQNNECYEDLNPIQSDNIFGIHFKENMFEEPSTFDPNLPKEIPEQDFLAQMEDSCMSAQTTAIPTVPIQVEYPPCRCYRVNCQKKYCECFKNGRKCTKKCICIDCHNQPVAVRLKVNVEDFYQVSYMFKSMGRKC